MTQDPLIVHDSVVEDRIDAVLKANRGKELLFLAAMLALFLAGVAGIVGALVTQNFAWSVPSVVTTVLLKWPMDQFRILRRENIALAFAPTLIRQLPAQQAAEEIQKLLERLFPEGPK